ncbi:hypothetical protein DES52_10778 [Deinococcus yavapaiensis KR-236]|uniref:Uncharacterized protein n=1 Tax=Deinococcus yavapaiensis KR-236 TaxID=694435 RepID=A0A318SBY3_9DEIO|nr:hypothetical protein DES52_10778 [Deinococcus yavapaiensis KR-236]
MTRSGVTDPRARTRLSRRRAVFQARRRRGVHVSGRPPSTGITQPVLSVRRVAAAKTARATSSGRAMRPSGVRFACASISSGGMRRAYSPWTQPGETLTTRISAEAARHGIEGGFAGAVRDVAAYPGSSGDRADVHDQAAFVGAQKGSERVNAREGAADVHAKDGIDPVVAEPLEVLVRNGSRDARVVHEDVQTALGASHAFGGECDGRAVVHLNAQGAARPVELRGEVLGARHASSRRGRSRPTRQVHSRCWRRRHGRARRDDAQAHP